MAELDDVLDQLQEAMDDEDIQLICDIATIVAAICRGVPGGGVRTAAAEAITDDEGDALYDPDELGLDPEEFDVKFWRSKAR